MLTLPYCAGRSPPGPPVLRAG